MPVVLNARGRKPNEVGPNEVYIGPTRDGWRKSKWVNPFRVRHNASQDQRAYVIAIYRRWVQQQPDFLAALPELRGKDLVCWCAPEACHGDVLLELANAGKVAAMPGKESFLAKCRKLPPESGDPDRHERGAR